MKYAVIRLMGHQYRVEEGEEILVDSTETPEAEVLLVVDGETVNVGTPLVKNSTVTLKLVGQEKGEKIHGYKYKAKSRYHKNWGHRAHLTRVLVEKIA